MLAGILGLFFLAGAVLCVIGLVFKSNRNDKEYVAATKSTVGRVIFAYVGLPFLVVVVPLALIFFDINKDLNSDKSKNMNSAENNEVATQGIASNRMPIGDSNNRLLTADEQREIYDKIASGMSPEQVTQSIISNGKASEGYSGVYTNNVAGFSIQFPSGWEVQGSSSETGAVVAKNAEDSSSLKVSRENNDDNSPLTLNKAMMVGERFLSEIQQYEPDARLLSADVVNNFNGHKAVYTLFKLSGTKVISFVIVPYKKYAYVIGFEGPINVFESSAKLSILSFKIL